MDYSMIKIIFQPIKFVINHVQSVLEDDAALSSHPIIQPVNHPDQITEIFDIISYSKVCLFFSESMYKLFVMHAFM